MDERGSSPLDFADLPEAEGWSNRTGRSRKWFWFMAGVGLMMVIFGTSMVIGGKSADRLAATGVLAAGATCLVVAPAFLHGTSQGGLQLATVKTSRPEAGVGFLYARHRRTMIVVGGACFAVSAFFMAIIPESFGSGIIPAVAVRVIGIVGVLFFGFCAVAAARMKGAARVVLTPTGVLNEAGLPRSFVPWDAISRHHRIHRLRRAPHRCPSHGLVVDRGVTKRSLHHEDEQETRTRDRLSGAGTANRPGSAPRSLLHYHRNPQDRHVLATEEGLRRLALAAEEISPPAR